MRTTAFIVIETKNGRSTPSSVWEASNEQDYINRVAASNPRSGEDFDDFKTVLENERHAMRVEIMTEADFNQCDPADLDPRVLDTAERLGWYTPELDQDE